MGLPVKSLTINQMLFVSHIVLVTTIIAGLSYSRFQSEWDRHTRYSALLAKQAFDSKVNFISGSVAGVNYANLVMPSTKQYLDGVEDLLFLEIDGVSDYSQRKILVRYSRSENALWRSDVSEEEIEHLTRRIDVLNASLDSEEVVSTVTKKKLNYLLNRNQVEFEVLSNSIELSSDYIIPWEKPALIQSQYYFDSEACVLHLIVPLTNANGGAMWAVIDAAKLTSIKYDLIKELTQEAIFALLVSIGLIWWVTHWIVAPIKNLASSMNSDSAYKDINRLKELRRNDEIGQLARAYRELLTKVEGQLASLKLKSDTDPLTGLGSRYKYTHTALPYIKRSLAQGYHLGLIVCDVDNFKAFNDIYGHSEGDHVLAKIGNKIKENIEEGDLAFRYGGEEFVILCARTSIEHLHQFSDTLRAEIEGLNIDHKGNLPYHSVTISMGGAVARKRDYLETHIDHRKLQESLFNSADKALYRGKQSGRNCVIWDRS